jgi:DNA-binding XRE family transcriptional regulator
MFEHGERVADSKHSAIAKFRGYASFRHAQPWPRANVYRMVRMRLGLSQAKMGVAMGISTNAIIYRERTKRMYHPMEIIALKEISNLDWQAFGELLEECS